MSNKELTLQDVLGKHGLKPAGDIGWQGYAKSMPNPEGWDFELIVTDHADGLPEERDDLVVVLHGDEGCADDGSSILAYTSVPCYEHQLETLDGILTHLSALMTRLSQQALAAAK